MPATPWSPVGPFSRRLSLPAEPAPRGLSPRDLVPRDPLPSDLVSADAVPRDPPPGDPAPRDPLPCELVPGAPAAGGPEGPDPGPAAPDPSVPGLAGSGLPPAGGSGRTRPSATTSLASRVRRFGPSGIRNFWYSRKRCCLTAASVTTRSAAISLAVAGATNASSDRAGRHSEVRTSSSRRVSSGVADLRSSTSGAMSSYATPPTLQRATPKLTTSPSSKTRRATGRPFTRVPFLDNPRSTTYA